MLQRHKDTKFFFASLCLSGKKFFLKNIKLKNIFILLLLLAASCKTTHPVATNVPVKTTVDTTKKNIAIKDSVIVPKQNIFHISLLLPLSFDQQFKTDSAGNDLDILPASLQALNFYEGFLLAVDTAKDKKNLIQYSVYDSDRDSIALWKLLNSERISKSDLVMAMLPGSWNTIAAKISSIRKYELYLLQGNNSNCLIDNDQTFLVTPTNNMQCKLIAAYLNETYSNSNSLIIYRDNNKKESDLADLFYSELDSLSNHTSILKINNAKGEFNDIKSKLNKTKRNILVIPTSDESYLSSLLTKLFDLKDYNFVIAGLPTWEHFESIDPAQLETFNTNIFNTNFIDYKNDAVKKFRKRFIETYHADPLYPAFQAYDLIQWVQSNIGKDNFDLYKFHLPSALTTNGIKPFKICKNCGFENSTISVLKYKDGLLEKVNH